MHWFQSVTVLFLHRLANYIYSDYSEFKWILSEHMGRSEDTKTQPLAARHRRSSIPFFKNKVEGVKTFTHCHVIEWCTPVFGLPYWYGNG